MSKSRLLALNSLILLLLLFALSQVRRQTDPQLTRNPEHEARLLLDRARAHIAAGEPGRAVTLLRDALRAVGGGDQGRQELRVEVRTELARAYQANGDLPAATRELWELVRSLARQYGFGHWRVKYAAQRLREWQMEGAIDAARKARLGEVTTRRHEALSGTPQEALAAATGYVTTVREVFGEGHSDLAESLHLVAILKYQSGDTAGAERAYADARRVYAATLGDGHYEYALFLFSLLKDRYTEERPATTVQIADEATRVGEAALKDAPDAERGVIGVGLARIRLLHGTALLRLQMPRVAAKSLERSCELFQAHARTPDERLDFAWALVGQATCRLHLREKKQCAAAKALFDRATPILVEIRGHGSPDHVAALIGRMTAVEGEGDAATTLREHDALLALVERHAGGAVYAAALDKKATFCANQRDYQTAVGLFRTALEEWKKVPGPDSRLVVAQARGRLGQGLYLEKEFVEAEQHLREAALEWRSFLDDTDPALSPRDRLSRSAERGGHALGGYLSAALASKAPAERTYAVVLAWKGAEGSDRPWRWEDLDDPARRPLVHNLWRVQRQLVLHLATPPVSDQAWRETWTGLLDEVTRTETELRKRRSKTVIPSPPKLAVGTPAEALPDGWTFIDFVAYTPAPTALPVDVIPPQRLLAFVHRKGTVAVVELGEAAAINTLVGRYLDKIRHLSHADTDAVGEKLTELVWAPLRKHLGDGEVVFVAPEGSLRWLPFAALPVGRSDQGEVRYLVEEKVVGYVASGRDLVDSLAPAGQLGEGLLTAGGWDFGPPPKGATDVYPPLIGSADELAVIRRVYRERTKGEVGEWGGSDVTREKVLGALGGERPPRWRYQFWSTHGVFRRPWLPDHAPGATNTPAALPADVQRALLGFGTLPRTALKLALSGANASVASGEITGEEFTGMDLRGCELVVLNACELAITPDVDGVGLGFPNALRTAGARAVVAALWPVSHAASTVLNEEFARRLWPADPPTGTAGRAGAHLKALREAQLHVLRNRTAVDAREVELAKAWEREGKGPPAVTRGPASIAKIPKLESVGPGRLPPYFWAAFVYYGDPR